MTLDETPWSRWQGAPSAPAIRVRVRRSREPLPGRGLWYWRLELRNAYGVPISFRYSAATAPAGGSDDLVINLPVAGVLAASMLLATPGPLWVDAILVA